MKVDFVKYFSRNRGHGNSLIIKGGVRKGKSTLVSMIIKILLDDSNFVIVTNVRFDNSVYDRYKNRIFYINSLSQYLEFIVNVDYENPILLVLDDAQSKDGMTSKGVMSKEGKSLSSFLIFIGKLQTSLIYIAHQSYIPRSLIEGFEPLFIYKTNRKEFVISSEFFEIDSHSYSDNHSIICPMPSFNEFNTYYLPILSLAFTDFSFDINLDEMYKRLTSYDIGENTKECIAEFLKDNNKLSEFSEILDLKKLSYEKIYIALCLKKNEILSDGKMIRDLINPTIVNEARKKLRNSNLIK